MKKFPVIDIGACSKCLGCLEIAPDIFVFDRATNMVRVRELTEYSEQLVDEAAKNCPKDCIQWDFFTPSSGCGKAGRCCISV
jgi:ferredoxin